MIEARNEAYRIRQRLKFNQKQLAWELGVDVSTVSRNERVFPCEKLYLLACKWVESKYKRL